MGESKVVWREPDDAGVCMGYYLLAMNYGELVVLGHFCTEDDKYSECDTDEEWNKFLQDEVVRLAEEKGFLTKYGTGRGTMLIVADDKCLLEAQLPE